MLMNFFLFFNLFEIFELFYFISGLKKKKKFVKTNNVEWEKKNLQNF